MTSRRNFLTLLGAGAAATLVGCDAGAPRSAPPVGAASPDVLLVDTVGGLAVLRGGSLESWGAAVASPDGQTIFATRAWGADTELRMVSVNTGVVTRSMKLPGRWSPSAASTLGVALVESQAASVDTAYPPTGRNRTSVLIVSDGTTHRLDLSGNYAPDAFANDGSGLFVLDWLPSTAPEHYRVREVNLNTGEVYALLGRDKQPIPPEAEEQMRGVRRNAVIGGGNEVLYTLYTHQPAGADTKAGWSGEDNAFIHTLHLVQHWAYCVDLPAPFGLDPNSSHAIAIEAGGVRLFVVDAAAGKLAVVDTDSLEVRRVVDVAKAVGPAFATFAANTLFIAAGTTMIPVAGRDLKPGRARDLPAAVSGLASSMDGQRLYVSGADALEWYDATSGDRIGRVPVKGLTGVRQVL
jgi:hypothetical protein